MAIEVPEPRGAEPVASYVVREDGELDLFIDVYEHPEFSADPDDVGAGGDDLLAGAAFGREGLS